MSSPFSVVDAISYSKKDPMRGTNNDELAQKDYKPFLINRVFSYHPDSILYANDMNLNSHLDVIIQSDFYLHSLSRRKRYAKWIKPEKSESLELVMEYYGYNRSKALDALKILSEEDLKDMQDKLYRGGKK